jgi:hypothetical protein
MSNPYDAPKTAAGIQQNPRQLTADVGKFVGTYLKLFALLSLAWMFVQLVLFDVAILDPSFVFWYWGGASLSRHSPTARVCVAGASLLIIVACVITMLWATLVGTESIHGAIGRREFYPTPGAVVGIALIVVLAAAFPLVLLLTRQARREFARNEQE